MLPSHVAREVCIGEQVPLREVRSVSLADRRGYLTVVLEVETGHNLVLRKPENLRDWCCSVGVAVQ